MNIKARREQFSFSELPKTFQDAIHVTRELRIQYLWIDSLCIIQWNEGDWEQEAQRMEGVFASAYCTIAATSAIDSKAGFLKRNVHSEVVFVQDPSGRILLSSFRKNYFMLDPYFPERLVQSGRQRTLEFIHFLFEEYSKRGLTKETDRCVAISGLEARIARARECEKRYGVFQQFLHRNLLWQPSEKKLDQISYDKKSVPSWSWMAYNGGIQFMDIPFNQVSWINNLRFDADCQSTLIADVGRFRHDTIKPAGDHHNVLNFFGRKRGWIRYDVVEGNNLDEERCVVVGKKAKEYYILVVRPTGVDGEYSRVGTGLIRSDCVVRERVGVRVV
ncbi:hypothetical protein BS50DRAFT_509840 [Corynespora cassiicola Philippines]|uniref:Heterokaryon incompatibility domain-containing protein n=1 Tax=Corynespora cassiicola Philippines TaxID=1448308 RepID=A0A2T2N0I5_CORCC|nr:hypothetical protein BS50DRAFT_509840 [Corynespora cassiicola Philippines]